MSLTARSIAGGAVGAFFGAWIGVAAAREEAAERQR
jgi:hypothetical protein